MAASKQQWKNRGIGAAAAVLVGLATFGSTGSAFAADATSASGQIGGSDRYETAALLATTYWTTPSTVIVANGETGVDALTASYLAGVDDAPVLLTPAKATSKYTLEAIQSLNPQKVIVIGGTGAVSADVYTALTKGRTGQRITGADRYETAANIVAAAGKTPTSVFLAVGESASGDLSADALAAGPIAYRAHVPILLTRSGDLPTATATALASPTSSASPSATGQVQLKASSALSKVVVVGGRNAVSDAVRASAANVSGATTTRVSGADRSETAAQLAQSAEAQAAAFSTTTVSIVNGASVDGLTAGPASGKRGAPMLLTNNATDLGAGTQNYLTKYANSLTDITVVGGKSAVPADLVKAISTSSGVDVPTTKPTTPVVLPTTPTTPVVTPTTPTDSDKTAPVPDAQLWAWVPNAEVFLAAEETITGKFDEALAKGTTVGLELVTYPDKEPHYTAVEGTSGYDGKVATFHPEEEMTAGSKYRITFTVVDAAGNTAQYAEMFTAIAPYPAVPTAKVVQGEPGIEVSVELRGYPTNSLEVVRQRRVASGANSGVPVVTEGANTYEQTVLPGELTLSAAGVASITDEDAAPGEYRYAVAVKGQSSKASGLSKILFVEDQLVATPEPTLATDTVGAADYTVTGTADGADFVVLYEKGTGETKALKVAPVDFEGKFEIPVSLFDGPNAFEVRAFSAVGAPSAAADVTITLSVD